MERAGERESLNRAALVDLGVCWRESDSDTMEELKGEFDVPSCWQVVFVPKHVLASRIAAIVQHLFPDVPLCWLTEV